MYALFVLAASLTQVVRFAMRSLLNTPILSQRAKIRILRYMPTGYMDFEVW